MSGTPVLGIRKHGGKQLDLLALAWVLTFALVPVLRFATAHVNDTVRFWVLILLAISLLLGRTRRSPAPIVWLAALVLIPLAGIVSGTNSSIIASFSTSLQLALLVGFGPFVLRYFVLEVPGFTKRAVAAFVLTQTFSAVVGILQVTIGFSILGVGDRGGRANGLGAHPNVLGLMAALAIIILVAVLWENKRYSRVVVCGGISLNLAALFMSGSLSSLLALGAGMVVLLIAKRASLKFLLLVAFLGLATEITGRNVTVLVGGIQERVDQVTGELGGLGSLEIRRRTWAMAWDKIQEDPIVGAGMDSTNQAVYGETVVHNYFLRYWYQGGGLMLIFTVILSVFFIHVILRAIFRRIDILSAAIMTAMITFGYTSAFYEQQEYWLPIILAVATLGNRRRRVGEVELPEEGRLSQREARLLADRFL
jgi:hypothetical protein